MLEFKGANDDFDKYEFFKTEARVNLFRDKNRDIPPEQVLNVIVIAYKPESFFKYMLSQGFEFKPDEGEGREWLWRCKVGMQEVAFVICRFLPIEERYYDWLIFTPPGSVTWLKTLARLRQENNKFLLSIMRAMSPKEYNMAISKEGQQALDEFYTPEVKAWMRENMMDEIIEGIKIGISNAREEGPETLVEALAVLKPEERLVGLKPEEREALLKLLLSQEQPKMQKSPRRKTKGKTKTDA